MAASERILRSRDEDGVAGHALDVILGVLKVLTNLFGHNERPKSSC